MEDWKIHEVIKSILEDNDMVGGHVTVKIANIAITDRYMSEVTSVNIAKKTEDTNGDNLKNLDLIVKVAPTDPTSRKIVKLLYISEIFFYEDVLPLFNKLLMKFTEVPYDFVPKYYKAIKEDCKEVIIMEDLAPLGYKMLNKNFVFTDNCVKTVLKAFGKFHALSFALQKENPVAWAALESGVDQSEVFFGEVVDWFKEALINIKQCFQTINKSISVKFKQLHDNFASEIKHLVAPNTKYPNVIVHMDPWCNNFLFVHAKAMRPDEEPEITRMALIDFQSAAKASPVLDISCFIYNNASTEVFNNLEMYLRVYHDSLCENGGIFNCNIEDVYSWDTFMVDWREYAKYGMLKSIVGISISTGKKEDIPDILPHDLSNIGASFFVQRCNFKSTERIKSLIIHCHTQGII